MGQRTNYWSCSNFADWIRGIEKGGAKTGRGWREWEVEGKQKHPIRFWIAEEALDSIQNFIWWPIDKLYDIKYYINNRWVTRTHSLTASPKNIQRGNWCDLTERILPCLFDELVNFVEVELAWSNVAWNKEAREKYKPPFWGWGWFRWRTWRNKDAGLDYLHWASGLTNAEWLDEDKKHLAEPTQQALASKEIIQLYHWWKVVRPARPDPYEASGWRAICDARRESSGDLFDLEDKTPEEQAKTSAALDELRKLEEEYEAEDTAMLIRLIKIRGSLWT